MNEKLTQLLDELKVELAEAIEEVNEYNEDYPDGVDPSDSGNFDDAFQWGIEEGEMNAKAYTLSSVVKRLKEALQ